MKKGLSRIWLVVIGLFLWTSMISANPAYAKPELNHVNWVKTEMMFRKIQDANYVEGRMVVEVWGQNITKVFLISPRGLVMRLRESASRAGFNAKYRLRVYAEFHAVQKRFPDGIYVFVILFRDGSQEVILADLGGEFPDYPVFTSHQQGDMLYPENTVFEWDAVVDSPINRYRLKIIPDRDLDAMLEIFFKKDQLSYSYAVPQGLLGYDQNYTVKIEAIKKVDLGENYTVKKNSMTRYGFYTPPAP